MTEITLAALEGDPHPLFAALRAREPVAWAEPLGGWLVTRRDLVAAAMRDADTFTVEDERFSTGRVVGPSMLTLDGPPTTAIAARGREPFRREAVLTRFADVVADAAGRLVDAIAAAGPEAELRRAFAGPLAATIVQHVLGLDRTGRPRCWRCTTTSSPPSPASPRASPCRRRAGRVRRPCARRSLRCSARRAPPPCSPPWPVARAGSATTR